MSIHIRQLGVSDTESMHELLSVFGEAFGEQETYGGNRPSQAYLRQLLAGDTFIALAAFEGDEIVGGLAAYELKKFEQPRSELYIYDLAVAESYRRRGVATALIEATRALARARGAWVVFVQADAGDTPAVTLYSKLGVREEVLHFDIAVTEAED